MVGLTQIFAKMTGLLFKFISYQKIYTNRIYKLMHEIPVFIASASSKFKARLCTYWLLVFDKKNVKKGFIYNACEFSEGMSICLLFTVYMLLVCTS